MELNGNGDGAKMMEFTVVRDGEVVSEPGQDLASPAGFLRSLGSGAYTAAGVSRRRSRRRDDGLSRMEFWLPLWDEHVHRLGHSLTRLFPDSDQVKDGDVVREAARASVSALLRHEMNREGSREETTNHDVGAAEPEEGFTHMVTVALRPGPGPSSPLACFAHLCPLRPESRATTASVLLSEFRRISPEAKSCAWATDRRPLEVDLARRGAMFAGGLSEVVMCTERGMLLEGTKSNVFVVVEDDRGGGGLNPKRRLLTPPLSSGILPGLARAAVIATAAALGIAVEERQVDSKGCTGWSECFLTSAVKMAQPVAAVAVSVGGSGAEVVADFAGRAPGPVTEAIRGALWDRVLRGEGGRLFGPPGW